MSLDHFYPYPHAANVGGEYSIADAARYLPISEQRLRQMCRDGKIPGAVDRTSLGLGWRIPYTAMGTIHDAFCHLAKEDHHA